MPTGILDLPYDQVAFKASHNSYDRGMTYAAQLTHHPADPTDAGCRGLELDLIQKRGDWKWSVSHPTLGNTISRTAYDSAPEHQLSTHLEELGAWSRDRPTHHPVLVQLDLKWRLNFGDFPEYAEKLDSYLAAHLDNGRADTVYTPGEFLRGESTLGRAAGKHGWPLVRDLRGRFVLVLSGTASRKYRYIQSHTARRLCFADKGYRRGQHRTTIRGNQIFLNVQSDSDKVWPKEAPGWRAQGGIIIRTWDISSRKGWDFCRRKGANVLSTDHVSGKPWAKVGSQPLALRGDL